MRDCPLMTPVVLIIFKRPETTARGIGGEPQSQTNQAEKLLLIQLRRRMFKIQ